MAGDWIPVRTNLAHTREVAIIATRTNLRPSQVVGTLVSLWCWVSEETEDGFVEGADVATLIHITGEPEPFWSALQSVSWLKVADEGITIPNFHHWLSESANKRLHEQIRAREYRAERTQSARGAHAERTQSARGAHAERTTRAQESIDRREEKRREEKKTLRDVGSAASPPLSADADLSLPILTPPENGHLGPTADELMAAWNAGPCVKCARIAGKRRTVLTARNRDPYFRARWREALAHVSDCPFLCGENDRGWVADIDWFLRPDTVLKIMEGKYDPREVKRGTSYAELFGDVK